MRETLASNVIQFSSVQTFKQKKDFTLPAPKAQH